MTLPELDYAGIFDVSPNPYLILDLRLNVVGANRAYLASTGCDLSDLLGRRAWDVFPADAETRERSIASCERAIRTRRVDIMAPQRDDGPRVQATGDEAGKRYWCVTHTPLLGRDGAVTAVLQHPVDVTERERLRNIVGATRGDGAPPAPAPAQSGMAPRVPGSHEANPAIQEESDRLRGLFEQAPSFMAIVRGRNHCFELTNRSYTQLIGGRKVIGLPVREALSELKGQVFFDLLDKVYASGQPFVGKGIEVWFENGAGEDGDRQRRIIDFVYQPILTPDGAVSGIFVEGNDVTDSHDATRALHDLMQTLELRVEQRTTELRSTEEKLHQAQKMEAVGQLTGGLAHDFNNLLTVISGSLEILRRRVEAGRLDAIGRYTDAAQGAARRAGALTQRLLAFSRRQALDPKPTDVNGLVVGMEEMIRHTVGPDIAVDIAADPDLPLTLVDPGQLENALLNLCINARDAMPDGGRLVIAAGCRQSDGVDDADEMPAGDYVSLCVGDTGVGMTPETQARAYEPFFTTKPMGEGTGLGLSMIYGFALQSGGQVRIDSTVGIGTRVWLYLPRYHGTAEVPTAPSAPPMGAEPVHSARGERILLVEDDVFIRSLAAEVLRDSGYEVLEAGNGREALHLLRLAHRLDLLVTDVGLPGGMNGRQIADASRALRHGLKVLFITGYAANKALGDGQLEPGMEVLTKPFDMEDLSRRVRGLIGG
ncbi:PAS domain-containing protein [Robbsia sp. Bb-Pol-6]|uniref:histidine kinase n=1 Tax=Robbsia betulipollinis TaxID=2981849 RepID=A0ABT3ZS63_9BURK|nr:PAS domain-containing protein [Robbsia betulipollinis]